jgi:prephenate dehydrogenase
MGRLSEPPFRRIAIVGVGLIGGSIALAVKRRWPAADVIGIDRQSVLETARRSAVIDHGSDALDGVGRAQLVILAAPVLQNAAALQELPRVVQRAVITDVGSTKRTIVEAARGLPPELPFVGGHPLSGAAAGGVEAARPDLFADRPWLLTRSSSTTDAALDSLSEFVTGLGAIPRVIDAVEHDRLLAFLSHLPQLTVTALMHVVGDHTGPEGLTLAGRGLHDTTRLASSPASPWRDIVASNGDNISTAIDALIAALEELKSAASPEGTPALERMFLSAARWKGVLEHW